MQRKFIILQLSNHNISIKIFKTKNQAGNTNYDFFEIKICLVVSLKKITTIQIKL